VALPATVAGGREGVVVGVNVSAAAGEMLPTPMARVSRTVQRVLRVIVVHPV
jgi:hypothetical protein